MKTPGDHPQRMLADRKHNSYRTKLRHFREHSSLRQNEISMTLPFTTKRLICLA